MNRLIVFRTARLALAVALLVLASPRPSFAGKDDSAARAEKHFRQGEKMFALLRFEEALTSYEAAFEAKQLPEFLFNIGQCHRNLQHYREAIFSFQKYLRLRPDAENHDEVANLISELEAKRDAEDAKRRDLVPPPEQRHRAHRPIYKKWWFWTGVAAVAAAGTAAVVFTGDGGGLPGSDLGNLDFPK